MQDLFLILDFTCSFFQMEDAFKHLPDIATIQPDRLIKYRVSEDRFSAEVLLPGLWYTDFDKKIGGSYYTMLHSK